MIQLPDLAPEEKALTQLRVYQSEIAGDFATKQFLVKSKLAPGFASRNKPGNPTFKAIRATLTEMCSGPGHCAYCEAAPADEVEHFFPKDLFPDMCYDWENFLYACGQCNGPKSNKFALFLENGDVLVLSPEKEPPKGTNVLINPRSENGMDFCRLNLKSFHFEIIAPEGTREYLRADYTFNTVLRLNTQREYLRRARRSAYGNYKARLSRYHKLKANLANKEQLTNVITELQEEAHPTVWKEMQRSHQEGRLALLDPELDDLFQTCPEALTW